MRQAAAASLLVFLILWVAPGIVPSSPSLPANVGGKDFMFCLMAQTVAHYGLFTLNPYMTLAGALARGVACGLAW